LASPPRTRRWRAACVDCHGFDEIDRKLLLTIIEK
jgi:hypothetical protein